MHNTNILICSLAALVGLVRSQNGNPETFWNDYPACERQCHQSIWADQSCSLPNSCSGCLGCLCLQDNCLCATQSWLIAVSKCVGQICGAFAVSEAASIASSSCGSSGLSLAMSEQELINYGLAVIPPSTSKPLQCEYQIANLP